MNEINEKCGIFGVYGEGVDVALLTFLGLFALQHRGQESSGITVSNRQGLFTYRGMGLVNNIYTKEILEDLNGYLAIGHNRYSTSSTSTLNHAQPIVINENTHSAGDRIFKKSYGGTIALAHNGNLPNTIALKNFLKDKNIELNDLSDSELMAEAINIGLVSGNSLIDSIKKVIPFFTGAFSLLITDGESLIAVRDNYGIRPLMLGSLENGHVIASETCAFSAVGAKFEREIKPGEIVVINKTGITTEQLMAPIPKLDIFEFVYFSRPDSVIENRLVYNVRKCFGHELAKECCPEADMIIPIPSTAIPVAIGYSNATGIPFEMAIIENRYVHRTFINPEKAVPDRGVKLKFTPIPEIIRGKRIIIIDDSIVRGTTSRELIRILFEAGAKEVHFLISSPPIKYPDFYGIDIGKKEELIAANKSIDEIREYLGATSVYFLSLDGLIGATKLPKDIFSTACFTGEYPIEPSGGQVIS